MSMPALRGSLYNPWFQKDNWGVEILEGQFQGVVFKINNIQLLEEHELKPDGGNATLDYDIINKPELLTDEDLKSEEFNYTLEVILIDIITEAIEAYENDQQNRTNDTKESGSQ